MVMFGHAQRLAQPLSRPQKRVIAVVVAVLVLGGTLAVVRSSASPASRKGCVAVVVGSSMGGGVLQQCGAAARAWCRSEFARSDVLALRIQAQCRLAGQQPRRP